MIRKDLFRPPPGAIMPIIPLDAFARACRIFLDLAYPNGPDSVPGSARPFYEVSPTCDLDAILPEAGATTAVVRALPTGHSIRLGSADFPFLRLNVQFLSRDDGGDWLFSVDTHDAWRHPGPDHVESWTAFQEANRNLKGKIETAWDEAGILTHAGLLKRELPV